MTDHNNLSLDRLAEAMHDAYEEAAKTTGWETNPLSRVAWADVPESNKIPMRYAIAALLDFLRERGVATCPYVHAADEGTSYCTLNTPPDVERLIRIGQAVVDAIRPSEFLYDGPTIDRLLVAGDTP